MPVAADRKDLDRDAGHLAQIAERGLAAIGLPAGVGGEADRGVQRQGRIDRCEMLRVERQQALQPLQCIERHKPDRVEGEQRQRIRVPFLLGGCIDPGEADR